MLIMKRLLLYISLMKNKPTVGICFLAGFLLLLGGNSCKQDIKQESLASQVINVRVERIAKENIPHTISSTGMLAAKTETKLAFKTGGIISQIYVDEGAKVSRGQVLAQLNLGEIQAQVEQANLGLQKAQRDYGRVKNLYEDSVATLEQFQDVQTMLELAQSRVQIADFNLRYSTITAPSNGKILKRLYESNELIAPGYPVFLFGSTEKDWVFRANLTDKDIVNVEIGDTAILSFDAFPGKTMKAIVSETGSFSDPYTGTYEVEMTLVSRNEKLVSGLIGKVEIITSKVEECLLVPVNAMVDAMNGKVRIYKVSGDTAVKQTFNSIGLHGDYVLAKDGVSEGDMVITDGAGYLHDGAKIQIIEK